MLLLGQKQILIGRFYNLFSDKINLLCSVFIKIKAVNTKKIISITE